MNEAANERLLRAFDGHDAEAVRAALATGADARAQVCGKPLIHWLLGEYARTDRFPECVRLLLDHGATLDDPAIGPVLLNDAQALSQAIDEDPSLLTHRTTLSSAFTSLVDVTLLHVAAEYGHARAACVLIDRGADVNARAGLDDHGMNGHTPLFHTVNSNANRSLPLMTMLLEAGARVDIRLKGLWWGRGYSWETACFDVTPVSYAQLGLLPQFHRCEQDICANIRQLLEAAGQTCPALNNIPNTYLMQGH